MYYKTTIIKKIVLTISFLLIIVTLKAQQYDTVWLSSLDI